MYQSLDERQKKQLFCAILCVLGVLAVFILIQAINSIKEFSYIGRSVNSQNTITVNGTGEVLAVPDIATFYFSVDETAKQMTDAQDAASKKMNSVIDALKTLGVAEKDIQTTNYSSNPKYEYSSSVCPQPMVPQSYDTSGSGSVSSSVAIYCPPGKQNLVGYEVNETVTVKVRKTSDAGTILAKVGTLGVTNISGISFTVDNIDAVEAQARDKAIGDAKAKAAVLSKSLGIKLSHIINFYENGNYPVMYANDSVVSAKVMGAGVVTPPQIQTGENKITSNVSITYEVK